MKTPTFPLRRTLQWAVGASLLLLVSGCVFGPEVDPIVEVDHPPFIDPNAIVPNPMEESLVSFNLALSERERRFQAQAVYDFDVDDTLTYAWVIRIGNGTPISLPVADRYTMRVSDVQNVLFATRHETNPLPFDPCRYADVREGRVNFGSIQVVIYDRIESIPAPGFTQENFTIYWTWPMEFTGQCPICSSSMDCFQDEICQEGVCVAN